MAETKNNLGGINKEQLFSAIALVKEYADNISVESALPDNLKAINDATASLQPLQYIGTDINNKLGLFYFPQNTASKTGLNQVTTLNVTSGKIVNVDIEGSVDKFLIQVYKFIAGESDIVEILKEFNNSDKNNFIYSDNVSFNDECSIAASYEYNAAKADSQSGFYETDEINISEYINISNIKAV